MTTPKITMDELVQEIVENSRDDRKRLIGFANGLRAAAERGMLGTEGDVDGEVDPDIALALSENMAKISDSLTKINQQLVMIVQIDAKSKKVEDLSTNLSSKDRDGIYDELERKQEMDA